MALNNGDPAPVVVRTDCIVLTGGHLKAKHDISVPVRTVGPLSFWVLHTHCEKASLLFTGVPACKRPLCKLTVFDMLRKKITEKRDEALMSDKEKKQADQEDAEEARFSFGGEECEDVQTPQKHKRQRTNARKVGQGITSLKPVITVSVPSFFGQDTPEFELPMLNSVRDIGISTDTLRIKLLVDYIHAERTSTA